MQVGAVPMTVHVKRPKLPFKFEKARSQDISSGWMRDAAAPLEKGLGFHGPQVDVSGRNDILNPILYRLCVRAFLSLRQS